MNSRPFLLVLAGLLLNLLPCAHAEPKAYDVVKYHGKAGGVTITFDYADGYSEGSEIKITSGGKTTAFHLDYDASPKARFIPEKPGSAIQSITLKMDLEDRTLESIKGSYVTGEKTVPFTVTKGK